MSNVTTKRRVSCKIGIILLLFVFIILELLSLKSFFITEILFNEFDNFLEGFIRSCSIMSSCNICKFFGSTILLENFFCMMFSDEIIIFSNNKKCGYTSILYMLKWVKCEYINPNFTLYCFRNETKSSLCNK